MSAGIVVAWLSCAVISAFSLWLLPEVWRGPSGRGQARGSRLTQVRLAAARWVYENSFQGRRARGFVPSLVVMWALVIGAVPGAVRHHLHGDPALAMTVALDAMGAVALLSIALVVTTITLGWPSFVVPPGLRRRATR